MTTNNAPTISLEDQIATQRRLVELYDVDKEKNNYDLYRQRIETAILASLEKLNALESQPVPVEPDKAVGLAEHWRNEDYPAPSVVTQALANGVLRLQSALQRAQECERSADVQLNAVRYRAEKAEATNRRMVELLKEIHESARNAASRDISQVGVSEINQGALLRIQSMSAELLKDV